MYSQGEGVKSPGEFISAIMEEIGEYPKAAKMVKEYGEEKKSKVEWYNIPAAFDIETSSWYEGGLELENKRAGMYVWQFGIWNHVTYGRRWDEFVELLNTVRRVMGLHEKRRLIVYVHNLPYEWQFMRKWMEWDRVFLLDERKPVYAISGGIEFRCSLKLSGGKSLKFIGDQELRKYPVQKLTGDLDYEKVRHCETPLTEKELAYCENDIRVLLSYIQEKIEYDGNITKIPLTNTGYVRQYCRSECNKFWKTYRRLMGELTLDVDEYIQLRRAFQGGFTHANANYVCKVVKDVSSYDIASSYPAVMVLEKYPMSKCHYIDDEIHGESIDDILHQKYGGEPLWLLLQDRCCMFELELYDISPKLHMDHPISKSKCYELDGYSTDGESLDRNPLDNGRIVTAARLKTTVTEQDLFTYLEFYDYSYIVISNMRWYYKQYLPYPFVNAILKLYGDKTKLKGVEGKEVQYMVSKNMINASFGMAVMAVDRDSYDYVDGGYKLREPDIEKDIDDYNKSKTRFLYYPWGVWITAYARANLFSAIIAAGNDYIYADTDSVKMRHRERHTAYFERYRDEIMQKIRETSEYQKIPMEDFMPMGKVIGLFEHDGDYVEFKTLGAKRYFTRSAKGYSLTMAGANKVSACKYLTEQKEPFAAFSKGLTVPPEYSGRKLLSYIDDEISGTVVDYMGNPMEYHEKSSIHMEGISYSLNISKQFEDFLKGVIDISE